MKLFPTTNVIETAQDIKPDVINELTRDLFELANGGIDEANLEAGDAIAEAANASVAGLQSKHFEMGAWMEFFSYPSLRETGAPPSQPGTAQDIRSDYIVRGSVEFDDLVINKVSAGFITGCYQITYFVPALEYSNVNTVMNYSKEYMKHNATHNLTLQCNGAIIGETDNIGVVGWNHTQIPFAFYHSGGDLLFTMFVTLEGGEFLTGEVATKRFEVEDCCLHGIVRKR